MRSRTMDRQRFLPYAVVAKQQHIFQYEYLTAELEMLSIFENINVKAEGVSSVGFNNVLFAHKPELYGYLQRSQPSDGKF